MQNEFLKDFGPMASFFSWVGRHDTMTCVILWLEAILLAWVVLSYDFTTNI